jgi:hypothetical protein
MDQHPESGLVAPSGRGKAQISSILRRMRPLWYVSKPFLWPSVVLLLMAVFIIAIVDPLSKSPPSPHGDDIAVAWNDSISRLGIRPFYPPLEDVYVGDVWATIISDKSVPQLRQSVRIGHIESVLELARRTRSQRPVFPETVEPKEGEPRPRQERLEQKPDSESGSRIALGLAAFPGVVIRHSEAAAGSASAAYGGIGASRDDYETEEIRIPTVETYGAPIADAAGLLSVWCRSEETQLLCTDAFVRRIVAMAISRSILEVQGERYIHKLQLHLITRVYLMREIQQHRVRNSARGAVGQVVRPGNNRADPGGDSSAAGALRPIVESLGAADAQRTCLGQRETTIRGATVNGVPAASVSLLRGDGVQIVLCQKFQRPLVFGFASVTLDLEATPPPR